MLFCKTKVILKRGKIIEEGKMRGTYTQDFFIEKFGKKINVLCLRFLKACSGVRIISVAAYF